MRGRRRIEDIPFAPARWPFFYGWFILVAGTLGVIVSSPGQTIGVSAFIEPLIEGTGLGRTAISMAYGIGTLASALVLTFGGRLYDRIGARWSGTLASFGMGLTLLVLSRIDRLAQILAHRWPAVSAAGAAFALAVPGFSLLRFLDKGC